MQKQELRAAVSLAAVFSVRMLGLFMIYPVFAAFARQLAGATPSKIGLALGIYGLSQGLLQMPFGLLSDRIRIVAIPRWGTFRLASMNSESVISRPVILTGFSRIRGRLHCGEAMEMQKSDQEEVVHRSR